MDDDVNPKAAIRSARDLEREWQRDMEKIREDAAVAHAAVLERERPKLYLAAALAWLGVFLIGAGIVIVSNPNRGHQITAAGFWVVAQGVATFLLWSYRTDEAVHRRRF